MEYAIKSLKRYGIREFGSGFLLLNKLHKNKLKKNGTPRNYDTKGEWDKNDYKQLKAICIFAVSYIGFIQYANESIERKELIKCILSEKSNTHVVPYSPIFWTLVTSTPHWLSSIKMVKLIGIHSNKIISSRKSNEELRIQRKVIRK